MVNQGKNRLSSSQSPYLQQHANNPVDWYPWGKEALKKAEQEDKPILLSIGYSACHWCHVMERESFEDQDIAALMNEYFVNIKVDREERPDIDHLYMEAVLAMGVSGGWPLNVFLLPDRRPFYGGTYFPPTTWARLLTSVARTFREKRNDLVDAGNKITQALSVDELERTGPGAGPASRTTLDTAFNRLKEQIDTEKGGTRGAPKFPMPSIWFFLLRYYLLTDNQEALAQTERTLDKMAMGGIFDHLAGGFARYSTDAEWFAPHFEKMLYDNGQLLGLYAEAYSLTNRNLYKETVHKIFSWTNNEMTNEDGAFFAALDADSQGEEGKYYVWRAEELEQLLKDDFPLAAMYYGVTDNGNWEHGNNILHRKEDDEIFAKRHSLSIDHVERFKDRVAKTLLKERAGRPRPGLDNKIIAGWNGLMVSGLIKAWNALGEEIYLKSALKCAEYLVANLIDQNRLYRVGGRTEEKIEGCLEDYSMVTQAFLDIYEATFDEKWAHHANGLVNTAMEEFYDEKEGMFFYTSVRAENLIARKKEIPDNVIPSSNSQMAIVLLRAGLLFDNDNFRALALSMAERITALAENGPAHSANWLTLISMLTYPMAEVIIVGDEAEDFRKEMAKRFLPNKLLAGTTDSSDLPLLKNRKPVDGKTTVYVCYNQTCQLPVYSVEEALKQIG